MNKYIFAAALFLGTIVLPISAADFGRRQKLALTIDLQNQKITIGEPIVVDLAFKNVSSSPVEFTYFKPHFWTPRIIDPQTGERLPFNVEIVTETDIPVEKIHRRLAAGQSATEQSFPLYVLDKPTKENLTYVVCSPGEYKVQLDIRLVKNSPKDWAGVLTSNVIPVRIVGRSSVVQEKPKVVIPQDAWEKIFFAEINKRAQIANLRDLRSTVLPEKDLQARVWIGFGLWAVEGFVIRRDGGNWSALHLENILPDSPKGIRQKELQAPKSGWENFWKRIVDEDVLTLPDSSEFKNEKLIEDGTSFVVETNINGTYRTYHYNNPDWQEFKEAKQMIKIGNIIAEEFDLEGFKLEQKYRKEK